MHEYPEARIPHPRFQLLGALLSFLRARLRDIMPVRAHAVSLDIGRNAGIAIIFPLRGRNFHPKIFHCVSAPEHNMLCVPGALILRTHTYILLLSGLPLILR